MITFKYLSLATIMFTIIVLTGCGGPSLTLEQAQAKLDSYKEKGVKNGGKKSELNNDAINLITNVLDIPTVKPTMEYSITETDVKVLTRVIIFANLVTGSGNRKHLKAIYERTTDGRLLYEGQTSDDHVHFEAIEELPDPGVSSEYRLVSIKKMPDKTK